MVAMQIVYIEPTQGDILVVIRNMGQRALVDLSHEGVYKSAECPTLYLQK